MQRSFTRRRVSADLSGLGRLAPGGARQGRWGSEHAAPRSSYANGSVANMVRSLLVIGVIVAALIAIVPRVNSVSQPPVDVAASRSRSPRRAAGRSTGP